MSRGGRSLNPPGSTLTWRVGARRKDCAVHHDAVGLANSGGRIQAERRLDGLAIQRGTMRMNDNSANANEVTVMRIVFLRLAVGLFGERDASGWWRSGFMSPSSTAFLTPVFGSKVLQARYEGVLELARRVHDEHIGVGRVFHPFRLPEVMEQRLFDAVQSAGQELIDAVSSPAASKATLEGLAGKAVDAKSGPAFLGAVDLLNGSGWVSEAASLYASAFAAGVQCFPYFAGAR